jgi:N-acyl-phosphatidylethanolamine-hydrolysing phospholipase D
MLTLFGEPESDPALLFAAHGRPGRFWNPWGTFPNRLVDLLRWKLLSRNAYDRSAPLQIPVVANDGAYLARREEPPSLTSVGHATFVWHEGGEVLLTDPHWGPRALVPRRLAAPGIPLAAVPEGAVAVVSHNHYDHLDAWTVARLPAGVRFFVPWGMGRWFRRRLGAAARDRVTELDWWQSARHGRWTLTCLPAQHWSNRLSEGRNATLWASWLVESPERRLFFAGDTGFFHGFAEYGRRFAPIDLALLPIGAYEPRWFMRYQHLDPEEAYRAFLALGARRMVAMHWGVFDLTDEPPDLAPRVLAEVVAAAGGDAGRVAVPAIGERVLLG